ncbi:fatty acid-binding protein-like [Onthophagus taurus]|uniref:fatty acid-binding protein-like n=1 Tax=Onthophagus taurus TaxID=166361 RepID=UPI000C20A971|nr:uncharacterized protein LOC111417022 [Onthophagus taurus]
MALLAGKYQFERNEKYFEYLKSLGPEVSDEIASKLDGSKPTIDVVIDGNVCNISSSAGRGQKFTFGETFDEELFPGITVKTTATLNGNKVEVQSVFGDGRSGSRVFEFSDGGLIIHYSNAKGSGKRFFKRV